MADEDNFDIDIYGDDTSPDFQQDASQQGGEVKQEDAGMAMQTDAHYEESPNTNGQAKAEATKQEAKQEDGHNSNHAATDSATQQIATTDGSASNQVQPPKQAPKQQGMKRKQGEDDNRPLDPGASSALLINDLNWWINEEDVRGWANQSGCEDELVEVTFNEHKVNGKSKGQAYVSMQTPQAATALKHQLESYYQDQQHTKKPTVVFNPPHINPYKTLPKDVPSRDKSRQDNRGSGNFSQNQNNNQGNFNQNRFNNRNNYNNRGGMNNNYGNRNFSSPGNMGVGGYGGGGGGGSPMNNFGTPMGAMNNFNNFGRGGNMMGGGMRGGMPNRGGRGGMMGNMGGMGVGGNMGMGMGGMGMGAMGAMGGNMGMMGGMGGHPTFPYHQPPHHQTFHMHNQYQGPGGFAGNAQPHFNPAFFPGNQGGGGGDGNWNPHGAKRTRQE